MSEMSAKPSHGTAQESAESCSEGKQLLLPSFGEDIVPHLQHGELCFALIPVWSSQVWEAEGGRDVVSVQNSKQAAP